MVELYTFYLILVFIKFLITYNWNNQYIKGATKTSREIIFVSVTEIGENTTNILNCYVSN